MDPELASTLQELERKIAELERTLGSLTSAYPPPPEAPPAALAESPASAAAGSEPDRHEAPGASAKAPGGGWSRIVDEAVERAPEAGSASSPTPRRALIQAPAPPPPP